MSAHVKIGEVMNKVNILENIFGILGSIFSLGFSLKIIPTSLDPQVANNIEILKAALII